MSFVPLAGSGYPDDYLFARIRARRALLPRQWPFGLGEKGTGAAGPGAGRQEEAWQLLQKELRWIFGQMNTRLREIFQDFFIFMELHGLLCCLRYRAAAMTDRIEERLRDSLLADEIRAALSNPEGVAAAIPRIASFFGPGFLPESWHKETTEVAMIKHFEAEVFRRFLQLAIARSRQAELVLFFQMQVDLRNLMVAAKHHRWAIDAPPPLLAGGLIGRKRLAAAIDLANRATLQRALAGSWAAGLQVDSYPRLEGVLLQRIGIILARRARLGGGISQTLDYLWQRYLAARNGSLAGQAGRLPAELLNEEFIQ